MPIAKFRADQEAEAPTNSQSKANICRTRRSTPLSSSRGTPHGLGEARTRRQPSRPQHRTAQAAPRRAQRHARRLPAARPRPPSLGTPGAGAGQPSPCSARPPGAEPCRQQPPAPRPAAPHIARGGAASRRHHRHRPPPPGGPREEAAILGEGRAPLRLHPRWQRFFYFPFAFKHSGSPLNEKDKT